MSQNLMSIRQILTSIRQLMSIRQILTSKNDPRDLRVKNREHLSHHVSKHDFMCIEIMFKTNYFNTYTVFLLINALNCNTP